MSRRRIGMVGTVALMGGVVYGIRLLENRMLGQPAYRRPPIIVLADVPEGIDKQLSPVLAEFQDDVWANATLCRRLTGALNDNAWVQRVQSVRRFGDGRVIANCVYRQPAAMIQNGSEFYIVDPNGIRLPGRYAYHPSLVIAQGVIASPPNPGEPWPGADAEAALKIINLLAEEPFFHQLTGVLVGNYGGRRNRTESHIVLATGTNQSRIAWGSAPGEEIEENTVHEKIELLRENYRRWGRIDAGRAYIDISTFPDRFTIRDTSQAG